MPRFSVLFLVSLVACASPGADPGDSRSPGPLEPMDSPCTDGAVVALALDAAGSGWVGCEAGEILFRTTDAGEAFRPVHTSLHLEVNQLAWDNRDRLLLCGRDYASPGPDVLITRFSEDQGWMPLLRADQQGASACSQLALDGHGGMAMLGDDGALLSLRAADGDAWLQPSVSWMARPALAPRVYAIQGGNSCWYGVGADLTSPPVFLRPADGRRCSPLEAVSVDPDLVGELWALASPDGGDTWVVGGRALGAEAPNQAVLYRTPNGGESWRALPLPTGLGRLHQLAFSDDGSCGVGVGGRDTEGAGGFVIVSGDQGRSWRALDVQVPELWVAVVRDDGFVVGGDDGFLGRGWCDG